MTNQHLDKKVRALEKMGKAIDRAIASDDLAEKHIAARWAAAWGLLCGIKTRSISPRLRRYDMKQEGANEEFFGFSTNDSIEFINRGDAVSHEN